jgi:predicted site-specific integrase-resolvase
MTEHQLERIHDYTKFKVVELLIKKHQEGITLKDFEEIEDLSDDILTILGLVGAKYYAKRK